MSTRREIISCRIPVFSAVMDKGDEAQVMAWRDAKWTVTSPNNKEQVDFYIDRAVDDTGAYKKGELYPVNTTQLVVSTRSENPALAELRVKGLDWRNWTRPTQVEIIYEEKENVDLNVTVSVGKLCSRISCSAQELATNPNSTVIFSSRVKKEIDMSRRKGGAKTLFDGFKRYVAVISIPHTETELTNACASQSLPGAASGIESADTSYNVDTDAFVANIYFEQVSNQQYAVQVGQHVGYLTFRFETEFSDYLGLVNTTVLAAHLSHIFSGQTNASMLLPAHTELTNGVSNEDSNIAVKGQCKIVRKGGKEKLVEGMIRVPLSNGMYACVRRPAKVINPDSDIMRAIFAKEWKRRKDPKAEQYEKIAGKIRRTKEAISHARHEMRCTVSEEGRRLLGAEIGERETKLERQRQRMNELMEIDLAAYIDAVGISAREVTSSRLSTVAGVTSSALYEGNFLDVIESINDGRTVERRQMADGKITHKGGSIDIRCASAPMRSEGVAVGFNSADGMTSPINWSSIATAVIIPATYVKGKVSTACAGRSLTTELLHGTKDYTGGERHVDYGKSEVEVAYDLDSGAKTSIEATQYMPLVNMTNPYFSAVERSNGRGNALTVLEGTIENGFESESTEQSTEQKRRKIQSAKGEAKGGVTEAYTALKSTEKRAANNEEPLHATYLPDSIATSANRTQPVQLSDLAGVVEYMASKAFIPQSRWTVTSGEASTTNGIVQQGTSVSGRALSAVIVHAKDGNGDWVTVGEPGQRLALDTEIGDGHTVGDLISEAYSVRNNFLVIAPVPVYDKNFSKRCVRLSPIGDYLAEQSCFITAIALGEENEVLTTVDGVKERRQGGVLFVFNTYYATQSLFAVTLPKAFPDENGELVAVDGNTRFFAYQVVNSSIDFSGSLTLPDGWTAAATVLAELPAGFPNGPDGRLEYPEPPLVIDKITSLFANFNGNE